MSLRKLSGNQTLIRILIDETVKFQHKLAWHTLLEKGREQGLAGCTVLRGFAGFGPHHGFHGELKFEGAGEFTMNLEIVDSPEKTVTFLNSTKDLLAEAVVMKENAFVRHYSNESSNAKTTKESEEKVATTNLSGKQTLLRIFIGESDKVGLHPLYSEILKQAQKYGLAGATVSRGVAGFGASSVVHEAKLLKLSADLPIVVEIVDQEEKIDKFMDQVEPLLKGALVTEEQVEVLHYKAK